MILRDSFNSKNELAKIVMVACINPGSSSADHTLNTLRYSGRLKASFEKPSSAQGKMRQITNLRRLESEKQDILTPGNGMLPPPGPLKHHVSVNNDALSNKRSSKDISRQSRVGLSGVGRLIMGQNSSSTRSLSREVNNYKPEHRMRNSHSREGRVLKSKKEREASSRRRNEFLDPKNKEKQDMDYLRSTLRGHENMYENVEMLDFAEKADSLLQEQEELVSSHMLSVKEQSNLLQMEGKMLIKAQQNNTDDEDIEDYVEELEIILKRRRELDEM